MSTDVLDMHKVADAVNEHFADHPDLKITATAGNSPEDQPAPADPPEPTQSPDELRLLHYRELVDLGRRVDEARLAWAGLKVDVAEAKKEYEGLNVAYMKLSRRDPMQRPLPLGEPDGSQSDEPLPVDDSWKKLDINVLDISPAVIDKLYSAGIMTLGDIQDYWQSGKQLVDVKGIGEASDAAVRDAFSDYGAEHPEVFGEKAEGSDLDGEIDPDEGDAGEDEVDGT